MALTLITGPANSAKAGAVLDGYRADLAAGRAPLLVVPTLADVRHYQRELARDGAVLGVTVVRFGWLIEEIGRRAGYAARRIGPVARERLIAAAIDRAGLRVLARSAAAPGFARAAVELVGELERSLVTPQRFAAALRAWAGADAGRRAYGTEVAAIYSGYARALERLGRVDGELYAWRALDALRAAPAHWGATPVHVYGFDDLTPAERDAVEALARLAEAPVTVSLPYEPGRAALAGRATTFAELRPLADRVLELPARAEHYAPGARDALHHLERQLFEERPARVDPGEAIRLLEAGGERAEVELVAAEVLGLLRSGMPAGEIAVIWRAPERYASLVAQVFGAYGVPFTHERRVPLRHTALGRALLALARCALVPETPADELLAYLRAPGRLARVELADDLETRVRRAAALDADRARAIWERQHPTLRLREIDALRAAAADRPAALLGELRRVSDVLLAAPRRRAASLLGGDELADARAHRALGAALGELDELARGDPWLVPAGASLIALLADAEVRLGEGPRPDAVLVAGPLEIRARRYRAVFLCGLQEGEFPAAAVPEPFLGDERRRELARASGMRLAPRDDALGDERHLFYACAARPQELLVLSWRSSDEEGDVALPSLFLDDVRALFDGRLHAGRAQRPLAAVTWPPERAPTAHEAARARAATGPRVPEAPLGSLAGEAALAALAQRDELAARALESYADCPVKWLVEHELRPAALAPDTEALVRGSVAHRVLERALAGLRERTRSARIDAATAELARELVDDGVAQALAAGELGPPTAAARASARRLRDDLRRYVEHEASLQTRFEPTHLELEFAGLELDGGALRLRGRIDRVDVDPDGRAIVRDYKSGRGSASLSGGKWADERRLQVALYLLAVRRRLGLEPVAGLYQPLRGEDLRPRGLVSAAAGGEGSFVANDVCDEATFAQRLADAEQGAVALARALRAGQLAATPRTCGWRGGCAYPGICRSRA